MATTLTWALRHRLRPLTKHVVEDGQQERSSLARASLSASHQVEALHDDGNSILLHRCRVVVLTQSDIVLDDRRQSQTRVLE